MPHLENFSAPGVFNFETLPPKYLMQLLKAYQQAINVNMICSITDKKGTIIYVNEKFCLVSGYTKEELIGQNHRIINSGYHPASFFQEMWKTIGTDNVWQGEVKNKTKDGGFYWVDTVILPVADESGKTIQYFSLRYLINEKKKSEERKEVYRHSLENMLDMTSHRVRKPIANCLGLFHLLDGPNKDNISVEKLETIVSHLKASALELDSFTRELTDYMFQMKIESSDNQNNK